MVVLIGEVAQVGEPNQIDINLSTNDVSFLD